MIRQGVFEPTTKVPILIIGTKEGNQGWNYGNYNREGQYVWDGNYNRDNNYNRNNYDNRNDRVGPYVPPQNWESGNREVGGNMSRIEDMMQKMMKRFDSTNENLREMRNELSGIGQEIDAHAVSIKHLEQQMTQLSTTVNPYQHGTLPSNTNQNPNNYGHCMAGTTQGGKKTIDPPMPSGVEVEDSKNDDVIEVNGESENAIEKELSINVPLIEALEQMPGYANFMKDLVTKKRVVSFKDDDKLQHCSDIATRSLMQKKEDPDAFTIPCTIGLLHFAKVLCDLGDSINLMSLSIYKKLDLGDPKPTTMRPLMADRTVKKPFGVLQDVLVKVESFIFQADFVILYCDVDFEVPIILGRPFLATGRALVDIEKGQMKFRLNNEEKTFNISRSMKQSSELKSVSMVTHIVESGSEVPIEERLGVDALAAVMMNFDGDGIEDYDELITALDRFEFRSIPKRLELDMKNRDSPPARPSVEEAPKLELKALPSHLRYVFLGKDGTLTVIIAADLNVAQVEALVFVLKRFKRAIGWTIVDIIGIPPSICSHKIQLMPNHKPSIEH
ncbi:hypothetical protein R3W88_026866 [Solanum pinnatisectum]|uniref:Integrase core domain containing protein n=1 Tax=Solanum pinnatisectum TaxID=50273 RepID=A0AAV9LEI0_9SOLN|nr:hypothetical protein R3W88_026866 [Solanum pinnatisectum]